MDCAHLIDHLVRNKEVFKSLLQGLSKQEYEWRPAAQKWCLLEIINHLYDEEREDFRSRLKSVLEDPNKNFNPIDPQSWVLGRMYMQQDYEDMISKFIVEREQSIKWLKSLVDPKWDNAFIHNHFGPMSGELLLNNWVVHDYIHIRQILNLKYMYIQSKTNISLEYAGNY